MAYTEVQLVALQTALAKGEHRVTFEDKTVEYRTVEELKSAIKEVERGLLLQAAQRGEKRKPPRRMRVISSKGF